MPSKRFLYNVLIAAACITAVVAIGVALVGDIDSTTGRILFSCLVIAVYTGTGLAAVALHERRGPIWVVVVTTVASLVGMVSALALTWWDSDGDGAWEFQFAFCCLTVALAGAIASVSLMLNRDSDDVLVRRIVSLTLLSLAIGATMVVVAIAALVESEIYYRLLAVIAVIWVLGTAMSPILRKLRSGAMPARAGEATLAGGITEPPLAGSSVASVQVNASSYVRLELGSDGTEVLLRHNFVRTESRGHAHLLNTSRFEELGPLLACVGATVSSAKIDQSRELLVKFEDGSSIRASGDEEVGSWSINAPGRYSASSRS